MKVMISQPMRGKTKKQIIKEREALTKELEAKGWEVSEDTVIADEFLKDSDVMIWHLAKSIKAISEVDAVAFMSGWQDICGCRIVYEIARALRQIYTIPRDLNISSY